jgi:arylsulfatase A-like enzyme
MEVPATFDEERTDLPGIMERRITPWRDRHGAFADAENLSREQQHELVRGSLAAYHATISYLDWNIGRILDELDRQGLRENTLVIYTTDHGDHAFDHGLIQKHALYEGPTHVPLVFSHPDLPQGSSREYITNLVDVFPTMLDFVGLPIPESVEGESRMPVISGEADAFEGLAISDFYSLGVPERMIRTPRWKYIVTHADESEGGGDQLYDLEHDPLETTNLAAEPAHAETRSRLREKLYARWGEVPNTWKPQENP